MILNASTVIIGLMLTNAAAALRVRGEIEYAFGRPVVSGPRRKRLSPMLTGSSLWNAEEMERELESVSFGDLFFERALEGSYSFSYDYSGSASMSYSYGEKVLLPETDAPTGSPTSAPVPVTSDAITKLALNRFACNAAGEIGVEENTSPEEGALPVQVSYSYSYEATTDDPNTVYLIEAAIVETIISAILDCDFQSDPGNARYLESAKSVSTTFSTIAGTDPCKPTEAEPSYCYIVDSYIDLQLSGATSADQARMNALTNIQKAMGDGDYASGYIPYVTKVTYLGPDLGSNALASPTPDLSTEVEPNATEEALSSMTKSGIALMSIGGVVLAVAILRRRSHRNNHNRQHVALKDEDLSIITVENSDASPMSANNQAYDALSNAP